MSHDDDYLSDAFLVEATEQSKPSTYIERRKEAQRQAEIKNQQNRKRSRHEMEREAREQGLSRTLFERAREDDAGQKKALSMMLKMGFKPGESLGVSPDLDANEAATTSRHRTEPIAVNVWTGKEGLGRKKRAISPQSMQKDGELAPEMSQDQFRERARKEYEDRRDVGRLSSAIKTCMSLDQKLGIQFNYLWLKPDDPESFPDGLIDVLGDGYLTALPTRASASQSGLDDASRLRKQMRADRLREIEHLEEANDPFDSLDSVPRQAVKYSDETLVKARNYCRLPASSRLTEVLRYLRSTHHYCFWCGTQYSDRGDMEANCPGEDEDLHE